MRIGLTPVILADQAAFLTRWAAYLEERCGVAVRFVARESYQPVLDLLLTQRVDAAWICGYPFVLHERDLSLLAVPSWADEPLYRSYLIRSRRLAPDIQGWHDLRDRVLAYSDPLSNSGWLVAQAQLSRAGLSAGDLRRSFFAHGHRNVAEAVAAGLAHAGSIDGYVWETMRLQGMGATDDTDVVWRSEEFGFPPLVTLRQPSHARVDALREALFAMPRNPEGRALLEALNLDGFVPGDASLFNSIRLQAMQIPDSGVQG
ncbi:phosphonate ABC transporter substrate-binding protein [Pseudazoarcus pumilus]|uniref:Phosphonate ABC transporter substrate-binding protein n=1 Tax=Pseudazoarcus pumilus TaxID=2067960 RepID=A0A2I6SAY8_9RHOO|nr:phosphonate ABC transporter substrate-binding protein [Pseudazoarcus pumilus]